MGAIVGGIVGSCFERNNIRTKDFRFFSEGCFFSDDSLMTAAVADAVIWCRGEYSTLGRFAGGCIRTIQSPLTAAATELPCA